VVLMRIRIVLIEPEGRINMGFILRLAKNFEVDDICVVKPKFNIMDEEIREFAARGYDLINKVKIAENLDECVGDQQFLACTTAVYGTKSDVLRQSITLEHLVNLAMHRDSITLIFGRESVGLTRDELSKCDVITTIETGGEYNVLNLSHAVAIVLYRLRVADKVRLVYGELAGGELINHIIKYVRGIASLLDLEVGDVEIALRHVLNKALLTRAEGRILYKFFKHIYHNLKSG